MFNPVLLNKDERKRFSLGWVLHRFGKQIIRHAINIFAERIISNVIEYKKRTGWINPEVYVLEETFNELISKQEGVCWNIGYDYNRRMWYNIRDIVCTIADEDSYYLIRILKWIDIVVRDAKKFNIAMHKQKVYWNWEKIKGMFEALGDDLNATTIKQTIDAVDRESRSDISGSQRISRRRRCHRCFRG